MSFDVPIAMMVFNRPDLTRLVFAEIAKVKPKRLFVIADGPRLEADHRKCSQTRAVFDEIDWECELLTDYSDVNLRGPYRCSSGLDWVFSQVDQAIILEDDCLPSPTFFGFCRELLNRYRHDDRVMHIGSNNFQFGVRRTPYSYYFSKYTHTWGWATWARAWRRFDLKMESWPKFKQEGHLESVCPDVDERKYWTSVFDRAVDHHDYHWDYAWLYACWSNNGLSIAPELNLVSNVGFRDDGTHTKCSDHPQAELPREDIWELEHPRFVVPHRAADRAAFERIFLPDMAPERTRFADRLRVRLSSWMHRLPRHER